MKGVGIDPSMKVFDLLEAHFLQKMARLKTSHSMVTINDHFLRGVDFGEFLGKLPKGDMNRVRDTNPGMLPVFSNVENDKIVPGVDPFLQIRRMELKIVFT